jgi:hypothetical protein
MSENLEQIVPKAKIIKAGEKNNCLLNYVDINIDNDPKNKLSEESIKKVLDICAQCPCSDGNCYVPTDLDKILKWKPAVEGYCEFFD